MSALTLYGLKNCDTCKKALKTLAAKGREVTFVDIRAEAELGTKVPQWLSAAGADVLVNRRSTTWRNLDETTRAGPVEGLLVAHPTLIKRPVIETDDRVLVGWSKPVQEAVG